MISFLCINESKQFLEKVDICKETVHKVVINVTNQYLEYLILSRFDSELCFLAEKIH